jgi:Ca2+/H+ antiporter
LYEDVPNQPAPQLSGNLSSRGDADPELTSSASGGLILQSGLDDQLEAGPARSAASSVAPAPEDEAEEDELGFYNALVWLTVLTAFIAVLSDALAESIEEAASSLHISAVFISAIVLPIVGNAAEHA